MEESIINIFKIDIEDGKFIIKGRKVVDMMLAEEEKKKIKKLGIEIAKTIKAAMLREEN